MSNMFILWLESTNAFVKAIRTFFAFFDSLFYNLISILFRAIFNLANFELVGIYEGFEQRIYVILGIFMLFKVTVSLISYLVNPDKISDKEQGVGKIVTRIITVLVMLIALPTFFSLMTELQNNLLPAIPRVIVGTTDTMNGTSASNTANEMSITMLSGFASVRDGCTVPEYSSPAYFVDVVNTICNVNGEKMYAYDYKPGISTIVGALMCYTVFSLCLTVAIRAFKLIILRMIAPIPVISYISPKSSKDGTFSTWTKTLLTTWVELFILLGMIYLVIYIIGYLVQGEFWVTFMNDVGNVDGALDKILLLSFLVVGLLMFARQTPKFIFDALGIKPKGAFIRMLGMGAAALGGVGAARAGFRARNKYDAANGNGSHKIRNFGASLFGGLGTAAVGGSAILSSDKPTLGTGYDAQSKYNATNLNRINSGSTLRGRLFAKATGMLSGQTPADVMRMQNESLEKSEKAFKDYKSTIESRFDGNDDYIYTFTDSSGKTWTGNYNVLSRMVTAAQSGDTSAKTWLRDNGVTTAWFNQNQDAIHKAGYQSFTDDVVNRRVADSVVIGALEQLKADVQGVTVNDYDEYGQLVTDANGKPVTIDLSSLDFSNYKSVIKPTMGDISGTKRDLTNSGKYKAAMADEKANKNK